MAEIQINDILSMNMGLKSVEYANYMLGASLKRLRQFIPLCKGIYYHSLYAPICYDCSQWLMYEGFRLL